MNSFAVSYGTILTTVNAALAGDPGAERVLFLTYYNPFSGTGHPFEQPVNRALVGADGVINCAALGNPLNVGMNDLIACIGAGMGATVVDIFPAFAGKGLELTHIAEGDTHANNAGHRVMADALAAAIAP